MLPFVLDSPPDNESYENMWECHSSMFRFARNLVVLIFRNSNGICRVSELIHTEHIRCLFWVFALYCDLPLYRNTMNLYGPSPRPGPPGDIKFWVNGKLSVLGKQHKSRHSLLSAMWVPDFYAKSAWKETVRQDKSHQGMGRSWQGCHVIGGRIPRLNIGSNRVGHKLIRCYVESSKLTTLLGWLQTSLC